MVSRLTVISAKWQNQGKETTTHDNPRYVQGLLKTMQSIQQWIREAEVSVHGGKTQ